MTARDLLARFEGDPEVLSQLAEMFLADYRDRIREIRAALARGDADRLRRGAHTLKGSVGVFGADEAAEAALRLEDIGRTGDLTHAAAACAALENEIARLQPALAALAAIAGLSEGA